MPDIKDIRIESGTGVGHFTSDKKHVAVTAATLVAVPGPAGPTGPRGQAGPVGGLTNEGVWTSGKLYYPGEYVFTGSGASARLWMLRGARPYRSIDAPVDDQEHWLEFAAPSGPVGATGLTGVPGPQGPTGLTGAFTGFAFGATPPTDTNAVWVDGSDESTAWEDEALIDTIAGQVAQMSNTVTALGAVLTTSVDPGYFQNLNPGTTDINLGSVPHVLIKRGYKAALVDLAGTSALQNGEMGFCIDTQELYIANNGALRLLAKVGGSGAGGDSGTLTGAYVELVTTDNSKYRLTMNDAGKLVILNATVDTAVSPLPADASRYLGLVISKAYGGGAIGSNQTIVSHSFIELYNQSDSTINLKGLAIQYGDLATPWKIFALRGDVKPYSSFLIRGALHTDPYRSTTRIKVTDCDMSIPTLALSTLGYKLYLNIPASLTTPTTYGNPANINNDNGRIKETGYINLFAAGGEDPNQTIDAWETKGSTGPTYAHLTTKFKMVKRRFNHDINRPVDGSPIFSSVANNVHSVSGNSYADLEAIDMQTCDIGFYSPRSSRYGQWSYFYDQLTLDQDMPNNINLAFGKDGDRDRTFTWHTPLLIDQNFLMYRKTTDTAWIRRKSTLTVVALPDSLINVNFVVIRNLTPGFYTYKVGSEGRWGDEYQFEVRVPVQGDTVRILHVTDQQGWAGYEYSAWGKANDYITANETFDFIMNSGDITQNANRPYEWRYYYYYAKDTLYTHCHMTIVGNNDLIADSLGIKGDPAAFTYYSTMESYYKLNATTTLGSADLTNVTNAIKIVSVGDMIVGSGIPASTVAVNVAGTTISMSNPATASATPLLTFNPVKVYPSVYSFNYGFCHVIGLNSNLILPFSTTVEQIDFIRRDMAIPANQKRWTIVFMHESPYTIISSAILRPFINVFDEVGVDLVLNGHHHCYSRSNKMGGIPTTLHFDVSLADTALKVWTAAGGAAISTVQKKFGAGSLLLDGVDDFISTPTMGDFAFASYPFTIDFWVFCGPQAKSGATIFGNGVTTADATARYIKVDSGGHIVFCPGRSETLTSNTVVTNSAWHHVAITRTANTLRLYIDGVREVTATTLGDVDFSLVRSFIGKNGWDGSNAFFAGYIDEFHAIKKVPKWSTDTLFTPPAAAYSATTDTDTIIADANVPGAVYFMSQATGYKLIGKTVPATIAPWRADFDGRSIIDPMYAMMEITWNQIAIKPYLLTQLMPLEDNVGRDVVGVSYHPFTFTKP